MQTRNCSAVLLLLTACQSSLPKAMPTPAGHGLEQIWIEALGLE